MNAPERNQHNEIPMPDSFGTGKQPTQKKSYLSTTLILLCVLLGVNLVTISTLLSLRGKDGINALMNVILPGNEQVNALASLTDDDRIQMEIAPSGRNLSDKAILKKLSPSVVQISAQSDAQTLLGSGLVLTEDGYILTNSHSVAQVHALGVTLSDGSFHTAVCVGIDRCSDLAVLKIEAEALLPAELGDADCVQTGDELRLFSQSGALKNATLCAADETTVLYGEPTKLLAVDLTEDGFVLNRSGQVIALQIKTMQGETEALPICTARKLANDLINYGCINPEASLGIQIEALSETQRRYWQLPEGVIVSQTAVNGSAYLAGVRTGDLLLQIDDWRIKTTEDYQSALELLHPGDTVQMTVYRLGQEYSITVIIQNAH